MKDAVNTSKTMSPRLVPYEPDHFWESSRQVVREELAKADNARPPAPSYETPGMTQKPLYKIAEVCSMFQISKPTVYEWVRDGKLKPYKIRSRVYFLWQDIQRLLQPV